jgi:hypothetical protein
MLIFQYDVGGVSYEASQDVTYLRQWVNLYPAARDCPRPSYDPQNPNLGLWFRKWMGLRQ